MTKGVVTPSPKAPGPGIWAQEPGATQAGPLRLPSRSWELVPFHSPLENSSLGAGLKRTPGDWASSARPEGIKGIRSRTEKQAAFLLPGRLLSACSVPGVGGRGGARARLSKKHEVPAPWHWGPLLKKQA